MQGCAVKTCSAVAALLLCASLSSASAQSSAGAQAGSASPRIQAVDAAIETQISRKMWPGAVTLIARDGKIIHFSAQGSLDKDASRPMPKDAIFRIFSMTKPIISVAAMMLVERGQLRLDDPITDYVPELKPLKAFSAPGQEPVALQRPITVQDLMRHTSGFTQKFLGMRPKEVADAYAEKDVETFKQDLGPDEVLTRLAAIPLAFQPGTTFEYGMSTDVLGIILERITKKRLDVLVRELVLSPLGMADTGFNVEPGKANRLADAFDSDPLKAALWGWVRVDADPGARMRLASAGMVSTAEDYFKFAQMIVNRGELNGVRLLSPKMVDFMLSDHIVGMAGSPAAIAGPGYRFGLGFAVRTQPGMAVTPGSVGDANWSGVGGTAFTVDPQERIVGVIMVQAPFNRIHARNLFKTLIYANAFGPRP